MTTGEAEIKQGEQTGEAQADLKATSSDAGQTSYIRKLESDLATFKGREAKAREELKREREEKAQAKAAMEAKELDAIINDPDATDAEKKNARTARAFVMAEIERGRKLQARNDEWEANLSKNEAKLTKAEQIERDENLKAIAEEKGVDYGALKELTDIETDFDKISKIASYMPKVRKEAPKFDSGKGQTGAMSLDYNDITKMSPAEYAKNRDAIYQRMLAKQNK